MVKKYFTLILFLAIAFASLNAQEVNCYMTTKGDVGCGAGIGGDTAQDEGFFNPYLNSSMGLDGGALNALVPSSVDDGSGTSKVQTVGGSNLSANVPTEGGSTQGSFIGKIINNFFKSEVEAWSKNYDSNQVFMGINNVALSLHEMSKMTPEQFRMMLVVGSMGGGSLEFSTAATVQAERFLAAEGRGGIKFEQAVNGGHYIRECCRLIYTRSPLAAEADKVLTQWNKGRVNAAQAVFISDPIVGHMLSLGGKYGRVEEDALYGINRSVAGRWPEGLGPVIDDQGFYRRGYNPKREGD